MDSGGPALVRDGNQWVVAGVVGGPDESGKTLSTDVTPHPDWLHGIITGTDVHLPADLIPDLEGSVDLSGCAGSVVRTLASRPQDPALVLTNGHCVQGQRPGTGTAMVDQPSW